MIEIEWEAYLGDDLRIATTEDLNETEKRISKSLPDALKNLMLKHGGETPLNLIPQHPDGRQMTIECIYHAHLNDVDYNSYTIPSATSCLEDEGYVGLVAFCDTENVFLCLNYGARSIDPPVVLVNRSFTPSDPKHKHFLADSFKEFLEKYTVPMNQVD